MYSQTAAPNARSGFLTLFQEASKQAFSANQLAKGNATLAVSFKKYLTIEDIPNKDFLPEDKYLYNYLEYIDQKIKAVQANEIIQDKLISLKENLIKLVAESLPENFRETFKKRSIQSINVKGSAIPFPSKEKIDTSIECNTNIIRCIDLNNKSGVWSSMDFPARSFMESNHSEEEYDCIRFPGITHCHIILIKNHTKNQIICDHVAFANAFQDVCYSELNELPEEYGIANDDLIEVAVIDHSGFFNLQKFEEKFSYSNAIKFIINTELVAPIQYYLLGGSSSRDYEYEIAYFPKENKILLYSNDKLCSVGYDQIFNKVEAKPRSEKNQDNLKEKQTKNIL